MSEDAETTALACIVAPDRLEDVVGHLPVDRLLPMLAFAEELVRRANALKKALLIESSVAVQQGEIEPRVNVGGRPYELKQDSKSDYENIGILFHSLHRLGASIADLGDAAGYVRATDMRRIVERLPESVRADAIETLESHRVRKPTGWALIDLASPYRQRRVA